MLEIRDLPDVSSDGTGAVLQQWTSRTLLLKPFTLESHHQNACCRAACRLCMYTYNYFPHNVAIRQLSCCFSPVCVLPFNNVVSVRAPPTTPPAAAARRTVPKRPVVFSFGSSPEKDYARHFFSFP